MTSKTLSEYIDAKHNTPSDFSTPLLAELLKRAAKKTFSAFQETAATAIIGRYIATQPMRLSKVSAKVMVCGSANTTSVAVRKVPKDGVVADKIEMLEATIDFVNTDADGINKEATLDTDTEADTNLDVGDELYIEVTAIATAATGIHCTVEMEPRIEV